MAPRYESGGVSHRGKIRRGFVDVSADHSEHDETPIAGSIDWYALGPQLCIDSPKSQSSRRPLQVAAYDRKPRGREQVGVFLGFVSRTAASIGGRRVFHW